MRRMVNAMSMGPARCTVQGRKVRFSFFFAGFWLSLKGNRIDGLRRGASTGSSENEEEERTEF